MKGWEILQIFSEKGKSLSVQTLYNYVKGGFVSKPTGPRTSLESEYPESAPAEAYAARKLLPLIGPANLKLVREIGMHILGAQYAKPLDLSKDPGLLKMIRNRPTPSFYVADWLRLFYEWQESQPPLDLLLLRVVLIAWASPPIHELEREQAEYNAKDRAEIEARMKNVVPPFPELQETREERLEKAEKTISPRATRGRAKPRAK